MHWQTEKIEFTVSAKIQLDYVRIDATEMFLKRKKWDVNISRTEIKMSKSSRKLGKQMVNLKYAKQ